MKMTLAFIVKSIGAGLLLVVPINLAVLILLKGMKSVAGKIETVPILLAAEVH